MGAQGRRKHLKLAGTRHFEGTFTQRKREHFLQIKGHFFVHCKILGALEPSAPGSYVYVGAYSIRAYSNNLKVGATKFFSHRLCFESQIFGATDPRGGGGFFHSKGT